MQALKISVPGKKELSTVFCFVLNLPKYTYSTNMKIFAY